MKIRDFTVKRVDECKKQQFLRFSINHKRLTDWKIVKKEEKKLGIDKIHSESNLIREERRKGHTCIKTTVTYTNEIPFFFFLLLLQCSFYI